MDFNEIRHGYALLHCNIGLKTKIQYSHQFQNGGTFSAKFEHFQL